jgi:hypothetical protein
MSNPLPPRVSKRPAAVRAGDKIKANLEQVRHWEAKEMEEANLKFAVSNDDLERSGVDKASEKAMKRQRPENQDTEDVLEESNDELSSQSSNSVASISTLCSSTSGESDRSIDDKQMTLSEMKRQEWREAKARARNQHSGQQMFLSRRLSRKIHASTGFSPKFSPKFSPLVATTLLFSPEITPHPRRMTNKEKHHKQKQKTVDHSAGVSM